MNYRLRWRIIDERLLLLMLKIEIDSLGTFNEYFLHMCPLP